MTVSTYQPSARPRPQRGHVYVVVDLGGTQTRTAIFDPTGQMLTRRAVATPRTGGPDEVIAAVLDQIRDRSDPLGRRRTRIPEPACTASHCVAVMT